MSKKVKKVTRQSKAPSTTPPTPKSPVAKQQTSPKKPTSSAESTATRTTHPAAQASPTNDGKPVAPPAPPPKPFNPADYFGRILDITLDKDRLEALGAPNIPALLKGHVVLRFVDAKMEHRAKEPRLVVSYIMERPMLAVVEPPKK